MAISHERLLALISEVRAQSAARQALADAIRSALRAATQEPTTTGELIALIDLTLLTQYVPPTPCADHEEYHFAHEAKRNARARRRAALKRQGGVLGETQSLSPASAPRTPAPKSRPTPPSEPAFDLSNAQEASIPPIGADLGLGGA